MMTTEFPTKSNQCLTAATTEPTTATIPLTAHKAPALSASLASLTSTDILTSSKANGGLIINQPKSNPAMNNYSSLDQTSSSSSSHAHDVIRSSTKPMHPSAQMVGGQLKISPTSELQNNINQISNQHQRQGHPQHQQQQQQQQQHGNEFLNQLSEVAVKRLDSGLIQPGGSSNNNNNSSSKSNNMKMATSPRSSTSTNRLNGVTHSKKRKNRNSSEAMFGNCLHPHPDESNPISSATTKKKSTKPKRDRSHLRKGKWTPEEEEYTSRIIQHFRSGLLTLPEGTTLRSYIAQKLACDPMRITKKFAGASCLGKRVYHLHERSQYTIHDIDMAKAELSELERRFRLRVEEGNCQQALTSQTTDSILNKTNQGNLNNSLHLMGFPFVTPTPNMNPIDPAWIAKYASTLGVSALSAPGLSTFVLQLMASQQFQQQQQAQQQQQTTTSQGGNEIKQQPQMPMHQFQQKPQEQSHQQQIQQFQQQIQIQPSQQQPQQAQSFQQQGTHALQQCMGQSNSTNAMLQQQQQINNILPWMMMQSPLNPNVLSQFVINQNQTNQTPSTANQLKPSPPLPPQQETSAPTHPPHFDNGLEGKHQVSHTTPAVQPLAQPLVQKIQSSSIPSQILSNLVPKAPINFVQSEAKPKEQVLAVERPAQVASAEPSHQPPNQGGEDKSGVKNKHSKEDVDAGNTLLVFLQELRKNHHQALTMPKTSDAMKEKNERGETSSVSTSGLISETSYIHQALPRHIKNDFNDTSSSLSVDTRSFSVNKDESTKSESIKSESSNEGGSADISSEDDQKLDQKLRVESSFMGPIRKRFRRAEVSSENVARHNNRTRNNL